MKKAHIILDTLILLTLVTYLVAIVVVADRAGIL